MQGPSWTCALQRGRRGYGAGTRDALVAAGFETLDKQADVLCLPRSTTWNIVRGNHKKSGLSANLLGRMLKSHRLPASVRSEIIEYIEAKVGGSFGHNKIQLRRFRARLKNCSSEDFRI